MISCRVCGNQLEKFMSFGKMPIANRFLLPEQFDSEYFFELAPAFCKSCFTFQIIEQPSPEKMFHNNYAFYSSTSRYMQLHFKEFAYEVINSILMGRDEPFVVEIGSNDGIMLRHFKDKGCRHLGIEPSENVADVARKNGVNSLSKFFDVDLAEQIIEEYGQADVILSANAMCHISDINSVARGISLLLKPKGVLIFEDPYLGDMISKVSYDQIYDEHVFIFSATSVSRIFQQYGLELINAIPQITHGGSMRYILAPIGSHLVSPNVKKIIDKEIEQGLPLPDTYEKFKENCEKSRDTLLELLNRLKDRGKRVVGYGATSKSTTVTNYCKIGPEHIEFISDTTPIKQGRFTPGMHIPVRPYEEFTKNFPEYALLFAWNHAQEIFEKEVKFKYAKGKWISYVPNVDIIE